MAEVEKLQECCNIVISGDPVQLSAIISHGHTIAIVWDQDGTHYGKGKGLLLYVDGKVVASSPTIGKLTAVL